jgi:hypothetical protein
MPKRNNKKTIKKNKTIIRKFNGGSCGCKKPFFKGGYGAASFSSFEELPKETYYLPNNYQNDPNNPSVVVSSRNVENPIFNGSKSGFLGGKGKSIRKNKRKNNKSKKVKFSRKTKHYKGGDIFGNPSNAVLSFGNSSGSSELNNLASKSSEVSSWPYIQPTTNIFNGYNKPLV